MFRFSSVKPGMRVTRALGHPDLQTDMKILLNEAVLLCMIELAYRTPNETVSRTTSLTDCFKGQAFIQQTLILQ